MPTRNVTWSLACSCSGIFTLGVVASIPPLPPSPPTSLTNYRLLIYRSTTCWIITAINLIANLLISTWRLMTWKILFSNSSTTALNLFQALRQASCFWRNSNLFCNVKIWRTTSTASSPSSFTTMVLICPLFRIFMKSACFLLIGRCTPNRTRAQAGVNLHSWENLSSTHELWSVATFMRYYD